MTHELEASQDAGLIRRLYKNMRKVRCKSPHAEGKCWESTYSGDKVGYARIRYNYRGGSILLIAHRLSWAYYNRQEIPEGLCICHHCDNPSCLNPDHLFLGTQDDNMVDAASKGRMYRHIGETNGSAKLNWYIVSWIRLNCNRRFLGIRVTQVGLVDRINEKWGIFTTQGQIGKIIRNELWVDPNWNPKTRQYIDPENIRS